MQLYSTLVATGSPGLARLVIIGILGVFALLMGALAYFVLSVWRGRRQKKKRQKSVSLPASKSEAVSENLRSIRHQMNQLQDEVARQSLLSQSKHLETSIDRQELKIVVFGTGSAGKTSLVNALVGRMEGRVSPTIGTTTVRVKRIFFQLQELDQSLLITDTPGLLEVGTAGTQREKAARKLATEADLLLFLVEGDLTDSEYRALRSLLEMGKRLLLVFNKTDRYNARRSDHRHSSPSSKSERRTARKRYHCDRGSTSTYYPSVRRNLHPGS